MQMRMIRPKDRVWAPLFAPGAWYRTPLANAGTRLAPDIKFEHVLGPAIQPLS
jgi:hypothetical protein